LSSHSPFSLPKDLRTLHLGNPPALTGTQVNYLQSIHYADQALGDFIAGLKAAGRYDNSLIVIYGDHQSFTTAKTDVGFAHFLGLDRFDQLSYLENSQVPLWLLAPGAGLTGIVDKPASHLDLYPTIANLLGVPAPRNLLGQDILATDHPVVTKRENDTITAIITSTVDYLGAKDGAYRHGKCLDAVSKTAIALERCRALYQEQSNTLKISDLVIRGNLIGLLK